MAVITQSVSVTAAAGSAGTAFTHPAVSTKVTIVNTTASPDSDMEYRVDGGAWTKLTRNVGVDLPINIAATSLAFRRSAAGSVASTVEVSIVTDDAAIVTPSKLQLPKWRTAMGKMLNGERNAKLAILGSSSITGYGAAGGGYGAGGRTKNFVSKLTAAINSYLAPASSHSVFGSAGNDATSTATFDPRLTFGSGWGTADFFDDKPLGRTYFTNTTTTNAMTFTPEAPVDSFEVYYRASASTGTFALSVDGGAALATIGPNAGGAIFTSRPITTTLGMHTLSIALTTVDGGIQIHGIRAWDSTKKQIEVFQWGHPTWKASDAIEKSTLIACRNAIPKYEPDLCVIAFAPNSWMTAQDMAVFKSSNQTLIDVCKAANSDVILMSGAPTAVVNTSRETQRRYVDAYAELAAANGLLFIDLWRQSLSYEEATALGLTANDQIHQAGAGYSTFVPPVLKALSEI